LLLDLSAIALHRFQRDRRDRRRAAQAKKLGGDAKLLARLLRGEDLQNGGFLTLFKVYNSGLKPWKPARLTPRYRPGFFA